MRWLLGIGVLAAALLLWWMAGASTPPGAGPNESNGRADDPAAATARPEASASVPSADADANAQPARRAESAPSAAATLHGRVRVTVVRATTSAPLPHVGVAAFPRIGRRADLPFAVVVTDHEGVATFERLEVGRWQFVLDRRVTTEASVSPDQTHELRVVVEGGVDARVRVVDDAAVPVAGADVLVWSLSEFTDVPRFEAASVVGATDTVGELRVLALPAEGARGSWIAARHPIHGCSDARMVGTATTTGDAPIELRLRRDGASVELRIADATQRPIARAHVFARMLDPSPATDDGSGRTLRHFAREEWSDATGIVRFSALPAGDYLFRIRVGGKASSDLELPVGVDSRIVRDVVVADEARVHGVVTSIDGAPVAGVDVRVQIDPLGGMARTPSSGAFWIDMLPAGDAEWVARHPSFAAAEGRVALVPGATTDLRIVLTPLPVLRGVVVDSAQRPMADVGLTLEHERSGPGELGFREGRTGADGTFAVPVRADDVHRLIVRESEYSPPIALPEFAAVRATDGPLTVVIPDASRSTCFIEGTLVDGAGRPALASRHLSVRGEGWWLHPGHSLPAIESDAARGWFRIGPLPSGVARLCVDGGDAAAFTVPDVRLRTGETTRLGRIVTPADGRLDVALKLEGDVAPRDVLVQIERDGELELVNVDPSTWTATKRLLPGRYRATVFGTGFRWVESDVTITGGATTTLGAVLRAARRVSLRIRMPDDEKGATFRVRDVRGVLAFDDELEPGERSADRYPFLDRGEFHVEILGASGRRYATRFTVDGDETRADRIEVRGVLVR